uniref:Uncharacterized protein n=1 Tax=Aegilops tauschii TaxID=37682 RepID=R7W247_AEGTA
MGRLNMKRRCASRFAIGRSERPTGRSSEQTSCPSGCCKVALQVLRRIPGSTILIMDQLYRRISRSIVKIAIGHSFYHGFVSDIMPRLTVMASAASFPTPLKNYDVLLSFPDGKEFFYPAESAIQIIQITDGIAVIECHGEEIDTDLVEALQVCGEQVSISEEVYTYNAYAEGIESAITKGYVMSIQESSFFHSCSAGLTLHLGALVINKGGQLVGLCTGFDRHLIAREMSALA